jgi:hypothetical protein
LALIEDFGTGVIFQYADSELALIPALVRDPDALLLEKNKPLLRSRFLPFEEKICPKRVNVRRLGRRKREKLFLKVL